MSNKNPGAPIPPTRFNPYRWFTPPIPRDPYTWGDTNRMDVNNAACDGLIGTCAEPPSNDPA